MTPQEQYRKIINDLFDKLSMRLDEAYKPVRESIEKNKEIFNDTRRIQERTNEKEPILKRDGSTSGGECSQHKEVGGWY